MNATGSASAEAAITIHTENVPGEAPTLSLAERDGHVLLSWPAVDGTCLLYTSGLLARTP